MASAGLINGNSQCTWTTVGIEMTKTVKEVFAEQIIGPSPGTSIDDADADAIIAALDAAGFIIMRRPKGDGLAIRDYVPADATPEQMREVIQGIGALLMREGYEANNYLDLTSALFDMIVDFQKAER